MEDDKMIRIILGVLLALPGGAGLIFFLAGSNDRDDLTFGLTFLIIGLCFISSGFLSRNQKRWESVIESALNMLRKNGKIETNNLAQQVGLSEVDVIKYLNKAKKKGLIAVQEEPMAKTDINTKESISEDLSKENKKVANDVQSKNGFSHDHQKVDQLKMLLKEGLVTEDEFNQKISTSRGHSQSAVEIINTPTTSSQPDTSKRSAKLTLYGDMTVGQLKKSFRDAYNVAIRAYKGKRIADDDVILSSIGLRKNNEVPVKFHGRTKVENVEKFFKEKLGISIQIENTNGALADNNLSLSRVSK